MTIPCRNERLTEQIMRRYDELEDPGVATAIQVSFWLDRETGSAELDGWGVPCPVCDASIDRPCDGVDGGFHLERRLVAAALRVMLQQGMATTT